MKKLVLKNLIQAGVAIAFLLAVWWIAYHSVGNDLLIPPLSDSLKEMGVLFGKGVFWKALLSTLWRAVLAFVFSFLLAVIFAVISHPWCPFYARCRFGGAAYFTLLPQPWKCTDCGGVFVPFPDAVRRRLGGAVGGG